MSDAIVLIGGGGHALVVAETALACGQPIAGFLDDDADAPLAGGEPCAVHLGTMSDIASVGDRRWILALRAAPEGLLKRLNPEFAATLIHPTAAISPSAAISPGSLVCPNAVVHSRARVGRHCIINSGAIVEHECAIGERVHLAPGAAIAGRVRVGNGTTIGLGSRVLPGVSIGDGCTVGAGAVVTKDVSPGSTVVGVPAQSLAKAY